MTTALTDQQRAIISLWQQVNASLTAYDKLLTHFGSAQSAIGAKGQAWADIGIHATHVARHKDVNKSQQVLEQIERSVYQGEYQLIFADDENYPKQLSHLYDPPPLLFVKGNVARLYDAQIAIVGSRKPTPHAQKITFDMAQYLAERGYVITSGLAQGVDKHAHLGALEQSSPEQLGRTVGVMGTGIDVCYPSSHAVLFDRIVQTGGCLISELLPSTPASKHTFPRRNRLVAGLSLATIVTEATIKSGSLITARLTSEQGKQVFAVPSHIDNANAEGCHHLIREGATLIYHPEQVIEDVQTQRPVISHISQLNAQTANQPTAHAKQPDRNHPSPTPTQITAQTADQTTAQSVPSVINATPASEVTLPTHLQAVYAQIDWNGTDLDNLASKLNKDAQTLLVQLMELELMGLVMTQGGRYLRV